MRWYPKPYINWAIRILAWKEIDLNSLFIRNMVRWRAVLKEDCDLNNFLLTKIIVIPSCSKIIIILLQLILNLDDGFHLLKKLKNCLSEKCKLVNKCFQVQIKGLVCAILSSIAHGCKGTCIRFCRHSRNPFPLLH